MNKFEQSLPMMLNKTLDTIMPRYRAVFRQYNITEQQWRILRVLWEVDKCTSLQLSEKTLLPPPSMVGVIDRMVKKELVFRAPCPDDRRRTIVSATTKGADLQFEVAPKIEAIYKQIVDTCDPSPWQIMLDTMQNLIDSDIDKQT